MPRTIALLITVLFASACGDDAAVDAAVDAAPDAADSGVDLDSAMHRDTAFDPADYVDAAAFEYDWACTGEVAPDLTEPTADPPVEDCSAGIWPDLVVTDFCPTVTDAMRTDPDTGMSLPPADDRELPTSIPVSESGSFLPSPLPMTWPTTIRVVAWNMEYSRNLDAQIETLTTDPELATADLYLLSEVDRCSTRNGVRRAARMLAERVGGAYAYGIEYVELSIGRDIGGDTGQAIVSRRPLTGLGILCHSSQYDWFGDDDEPRMGQRVVLYGEIPAGDTHVRVNAIHFESKDAFGEKRSVQVKELLDVSQALACERPQIIAGDFNTWYATAPELVLLRNAGFSDVLEALGDTDTTHDNGLRLDYIWARGLSPSDGGVLREVRTSDHRPIWAELTLD
jgi:endonuclease/exonuclease/phosphatase family metal-dependent hydrolase